MQVLETGFEPLPPHSDQAEESTLGSVLIDTESIDIVAMILRPGDFYHPRNRDIYQAMLNCYERGQPTDFVTVCNELDSLDQMDRIGGVSYLTDLLGVVPTAMHCEHYATIVANAATRRRVIQAAGQIAAVGYDTTIAEDEVVPRSESIIGEITKVVHVEQTYSSIGEIASEYLEQINLGGGVSENAIMSGFIDLDHMLGGFQRTDLIILAARPSQGKSALALNITRNAVKAQKGVLFFSVEMSKRQLVERMLCSEANIDSMRLRNGLISPDEFGRLSHAYDDVSTLPIYIDDKTDLTIGQVRSRARRIAYDHQIDLIVIDYLQLLTGSSQRENRVQEVSEISRKLKAMARELNVPVVALSQLSRSVESRNPHIPMLSDLRESGSIEQDADVVLFIYREDLYDRDSERKGIADVYVSKHRNGPTGMISLAFIEKRVMFVNFTKNPYDPAYEPYG